MGVRSALILLRSSLLLLPSLEVCNSGTVEKCINSGVFECNEYQSYNMSAPAHRPAKRARTSKDESKSAVSGPKMVRLLKLFCHVFRCHCQSDCSVDESVNDGQSYMQDGIDSSLSLSD